MNSCHLILSVNGERRDAYLTGLLEPSDDFSRRALDTLILTDISTAQFFSGTKGKLTQIDLILPDTFDLNAAFKSTAAGNIARPLRNPQQPGRCR